MDTASIEDEPCNVAVRVAYEAYDPHLTAEEVGPRERQHLGLVVEPTQDQSVVLDAKTVERVNLPTVVRSRVFRKLGR